MQGQSREEANSGLDEAQRAREQLALESMRSLTESLRRMKSAEDRAEYSKIERIRGGPGRIQQDRTDPRSSGR